jgi:hypothetical protein
LNGFLRCGVVLEGEFGATEIEIRRGQVVVERDGLGELGAGLIILAETEIGGAERIMRRDETGVDGGCGGQVLDGSLKIFAQQKLIALFVFVARLARSFQVEFGERAVGGIEGFGLDR